MPLGERTDEGFFRIRGGLETAIARAVAYAPYADLLWCETSHPDLEEARRFAEGVHREFPGKMLAYNSSPSFNWKRHLDDAMIGRFQRRWRWRARRKRSSSEGALALEASSA